MFPPRTIAALGTLLAAAAVGAGAFHAHGLRERLLAAGWEIDLDKRLAWFDTAVRYQMFHALGLVALGAAFSATPASWQGVAAGLLLAGTALFCGTLYAMTFLGPSWRWLGAITPLGGLAMIAG